MYSFSVNWTSIGFSIFMIADASLFAVLAFFEVLFLWNILRYGAPPVIVAILFTGILVGSEFFLAYEWFEELLPIFIDSLPLRSFIVLLLFTISSLYYSSKIAIAKVEEDNFRQEELSLKENQKRGENAITRLTIKSGNGIKVISIEDVIYIKAEGDYISVHTDEGYWLKEQTMKSIEEQLPPNLFVRVHRSYIINATALTSIERYGQQQLVQMRSGDKIKISSTGYKLLRERLSL